MLHYFQKLYIFATPAPINNGEKVDDPLETLALLFVTYYSIVRRG